MTATTPTTPQPEPSWRDGLSRNDQLAVSSYALGWLRHAHPDEVKKAIAYGLGQLELERECRVERNRAVREAAIWDAVAR